MGGRTCLISRVTRTRLCVVAPSTRWAAVPGDAPMPFKQGHLRYFVTVAEEGQVTRAAERLHIAQPALSQAIAHLECDIGFRLLERHPRGVTLTPAGEVFLEKARAALTATEDAVLTAESLARTHQGTITFGYLGLPPASSDPGLIEAFTEAHPDIQLVPQELPYPSLPTASWLREVDAAICSRPAADPNVAFQALRAEPLILLAPKGHPLAQRREVAVAEVLDETFIGFHRSIDPAWAGFWSLDDHRDGQAPHVVGEATNAQQRFAMLAAGLGIAHYRLPTSQRSSRSFQRRRDPAYRRRSRDHHTPRARRASKPARRAAFRDRPSTRRFGC